MVKPPPFEETTLRRSVSVKNGGGKRTGCNAPRFQIVEAVRHIDEMFSDVDRCCIGSHGALRRDAPWRSFLQHLKMIMNLGHNIVKEAKNMVDSLWCCS